MNTNGGVDSIQEQIVALLPRLRRFARNLARNPHDADDVVQIAWNAPCSEWINGAGTRVWIVGCSKS